jgi:hypothetical protein
VTDPEAINPSPDSPQPDRDGYKGRSTATGSAAGQVWNAASVIGLLSVLALGR